MRESRRNEHSRDLPQVQSLDDMMQNLDLERGITLVAPFTVSRKQLLRLLPDEPPLLEPVGLRSGIELFPFRSGYFGVPFCQSFDSQVTCYPVGPGPDDDPRGFSCVCTGNYGDDTAVPVIPGDPQVTIEPCVLQLGLKGSSFRFECVSQSCSGKCRMVKQLFGRLRIGCECS